MCIVLTGYDRINGVEDFLGDLWYIDVAASPLQWVQVTGGTYIPAGRIQHGMISVGSSIYVRTSDSVTICASVCLSKCMLV